MTYYVRIRLCYPSVHFLGTPSKAECNLMKENIKTDLLRQLKPENYKQMLSGEVLKIAGFAYEAELYSLHKYPTNPPETNIVTADLEMSIV